MLSPLRKKNSGSTREISKISHTVCGIVGNVKLVNDVAYESYIVKSISVNKPSSVSHSNRIYFE